MHQVQQPAVGLPAVTVASCTAVHDAHLRGVHDTAHGLACMVAGGGSLARSAKLMEVPRRMWSRNCRSTSFRKSCVRFRKLSAAEIAEHGRVCGSGEIGIMRGSLHVNAVQC